MVESHCSDAQAVGKQSSGTGSKFLFILTSTVCTLTMVIGHSRGPSLLHPHHPSAGEQAALGPVSALQAPRQVQGDLPFCEETIHSDDPQPGSSPD